MLKRAARVQTLQNSDTCSVTLCSIHTRALCMCSQIQTSSSHTRWMMSQSASHHGDSNSTYILLHVPNPSFWTEWSLCAGRGGRNRVEWCFLRYPGEKKKLSDETFCHTIKKRGNDSCMRLLWETSLPVLWQYWLLMIDLNDLNDIYLVGFHIYYFIRFSKRTVIPECAVYIEYPVCTVKITLPE